MQETLEANRETLLASTIAEKIRLAAAMARLVKFNPFAQHRPKPMVARDAVRRRKAKRKAQKLARRRNRR